MRIFERPHIKFGVFIRDYLPWIYSTFLKGDIILGTDKWDYYLPTPAEDITEDEARAKYSVKCISRFGIGTVKPEIIVPDPIKCDIVVSPRAKCGDRKDHYDWASLIQRLKAIGLIVAVVGREEQSQVLEADLYSWQYERGDIRLLAGAKWAVTLDSGVGHLASLINTPQLVIYEKPGYENANLELEPNLYSQMRFNDMAIWNTRFAAPVYSQDQIMEYIMSETIRVTDAEIEALKSQHISATPYIDGVVLQSPNATLVMRQTGNEYVKTAGLLKQMTGLTVSIAEAVGGIAQGKPLLAPDLMVQNRLAICKACPYGNGEVFCKSCGCITEAKVRLSTSHCPEGKWRSL